MNKDKNRNREEGNYIKRYLENNYTLGDSERFLEAIKEEKDTEVIDSYAKKIWNEALQVAPPSHAEEKVSYSEVNRIFNIASRKPLPSQLITILSVAASVIILLGVVYGSYKYLSFSEPQKTSYVKVITTIGETKTVILPDGSTVTLNSCSRISYPEKFVGDQRLIDLVGEAYFQVARNEELPFIIKTDKFNVKVLGTEFNIKAYQESEISSVSVQSGKVQVDMPDAMMRLVTDEKMLINSQTNSYSKDKDENNIAVWRFGKLQFNKTPMRDVVKELERLYNYKISFKSNQAFDNLITGEHSSKNLEYILKSIESITGIHYTIDEKNKEVLLYKK